MSKTAASRNQDSITSITKGDFNWAFLGDGVAVHSHIPLLLTIA